MATGNLRDANFIKFFHYYKNSKIVSFLVSKANLDKTLLIFLSFVRLLSVLVRIKKKAKNNLKAF